MAAGECIWNDGGSVDESCCEYHPPKAPWAARWGGIPISPSGRTANFSVLGDFGGTLVIIGSLLIPMLVFCASILQIRNRVLNLDLGTAYLISNLKIKDFVAMESNTSRSTKQGMLSCTFGVTTSTAWTSWTRPSPSWQRPIHRSSDTRIFALHCKRWGFLRITSSLVSIAWTLTTPIKCLWRISAAA